MVKTTTSSAPKAPGFVSTPDQPSYTGEALWKRRLKQIGGDIDSIRLPQDSGSSELDQDEEWCEVVYKDGNVERIRFHDYDRIYEVPGLYERLFYDRLGCCSPERVVELFRDVVIDAGAEMDDLRLLDFGAGNGMVGDELRSAGTGRLVGVDILPEAKMATERDRPGVYNDYVVADFCDLPEPLEESLRRERFNALSTVAALGFGDVPEKAFFTALDLVEPGGWLAFNIKEDFLIGHQEPGSFAALVRDLFDRGILRQHATRRYCHRRNVAGDDLHYVVLIGEKLKDLPDELHHRFG